MSPPTAVSDPEPDLGRLLGLGGPGAWAIAGLFGVTFTVLAVSAGGRPMQSPLGWVALALVLAAAVVLVLPWRDPLPLGVVLPVLAVVAFSTAAIVWQLPAAGWPGWGGWTFGADTFLLYMVALRGRTGWGSIGMLLLVGITMQWAVVTTGDWLRGFDLTYTQVFSYCAVAFFALWLRRTARGIAEYRAAQYRQAELESAQTSAAEERRRLLERVRRDAGPALEAIAAGTATAVERTAHGLLEAELRDRIRGRALATGPLPAALRDARARGSEIAVLDDLRDDALDPVFLAAALEWAAGRVARLDGEEATLRLSRAGGHPVLTFAAGGRAELFEG